MKVELNKKNKKKLQKGFSQFGAAALLLLLARLLPNFADWYSKVPYRILVNILGRVSGILPFSLVEFIIYAGILSLIVRVIVFIKKCIHEQQLQKELLKSGGCKFVSFIGGVCFMFVLTCGIQYSATPFSEEAGLEVGNYSTDDLVVLANKLTQEVNERSDQVQRTEEGTLLLNSGYRREGVEAMKTLGTIYPELDGYYPMPKEITFSYILSIQNLTGVYSPFTIEANYNGDMTSYNVPFTICHELSHLSGYMREDEANYIAYLACINGESKEFQYSGNLMAWIYTMNALYKVDMDEYENVYQKLDQDVQMDLQANQEFWKDYDGKTAELAEKVNDTYLKANNQKDGVNSYGRMVDLLIAYHLR